MGTPFAPSSGNFRTDLYLLGSSRTADSTEEKLPPTGLLLSSHSTCGSGTPSKTQVSCCWRLEAELEEDACSEDTRLMARGGAVYWEEDRKLELQSWRTVTYKHSHAK